MSHLARQFRQNPEMVMSCSTGETNADRRSRESKLEVAEEAWGPVFRFAARCGRPMHKAEAETWFEALPVPLPCDRGH